MKWLYRLQKKRAIKKAVKNGKIGIRNIAKSDHDDMTKNILASIIVGIVEDQIKAIIAQPYYDRKFKNGGIISGENK